MNYSIHYCICNSRVGKQVIPMRMWDLPGKDSRCFVVSAFCNFKDISAFFQCIRLKSDVIQNQKLYILQLLHKPGISILVFCILDFQQKLWHTVVFYSVTMATSIIAQSTCQKSFTSPSFTCYHDIQFLNNKGAGRECLY